MKCCQLNENHLVTAHTSKNMIRSTWLDVSFSSHVEKAIRAIWLAVGFLDQLVNQIYFAPFQWVNLSTYIIIQITLHLTLILMIQVVDDAVRRGWQILNVSLLGERTSPGYRFRQVYLPQFEVGHSFEVETQLTHDQQGCHLFPAVALHIQILTTK